MKRYIKKGGGKRLMKKRHPFYDVVRRWVNGQKNRAAALLLVGAMGLSLSSSLISYTAAAISDPSLCEHHPAHTELCGYTRESAETPCGHVHDRNCGYVEAQDEIACDQGCTDTDGDGRVDHAEGCAYRPAVEGRDCTHRHDDSCGYSEGTAGTPCAFVCPICHRDLYRYMDGDVTILTPEGEDNIVPAGRELDLLAGVSLSVDKEGGNAPEDYHVALFTLLDSETREPVEPEDGCRLTPEEGHSYLMVYAAYDARGNLVAAAERAMTAVKTETLTGDDPEGKTVTFTDEFSSQNLIFTLEVDFSDCDMTEAELKAVRTAKDNTTLRLLSGVTGYTGSQNLPSTLTAYFETNYTDVTIKDRAVHIRIFEQGGSTLFPSEAERDKAKVTLKVTATEGKDLGVGTGKKALAALCNVDGTNITFANETASVSAWSYVGDSITSVTVQGTYSELVGDTISSGHFQGPGIVFASANEKETPVDIPQETLDALAEEHGIYPGTKETVGGREVWTVYDAADAESASIQATVTLPAGTSANPGHYLYIRKVGTGDPYYPEEEALLEMAGEYNAMQCYAIHWVRFYQEDGVWKYDVDTATVLPGNDLYATVEIKYLDDDAYLGGGRAHRKLLVFNSRQADGSDLENASTPIDVSAGESAYTGFTFTTNRGGPYVFVSKHLYDGYVRSFAVSKTIDGSGPFDQNSDPGNDSSDSNGIVRSYDTLQYNLTANFGARSATAVAKQAEMGFELTLDADVTEAVFNPSQMLWIGSDYTIEYLDQDGKVVLTQGADGKYYRDGKVVSLNDIVSDSTKGENSYTTGIVSQHLKGTVTITDENNVLSGNQTFEAAIQVLGAEHGSTIQPTFKAWLIGNEDNYGSENTGIGDDVTLAEPVTDNEVHPEPVTVSAAARFNLELAKNANVTYKGWFDSNSGKEISDTNTDAYQVGGKAVTGKELYTLLEKLAELEENAGKSNPEEFTDGENVCAEERKNLALNAYKSVFQNIRYGRLTGYGITLQVYNDVSAGAGTADKTFRGVSLPRGPVSFDLDLSASVNVTVGSVREDQYYAQLWEYNENENQRSGNRGRNMYWAQLASTGYAAWAAPYNSGGGTSSCYQGGAWDLSGGQGYHFTVDAYDFNFLSTGLEFPTHRAGNGSATTGYNAYIGCFSAGYVQVLNVMPRYQTGTLNMHTVVTVKDLCVTTTDGNTLSADPGDQTGYAHETNRGDNVVGDDIPLYSRGGITKANAFCDAATFDVKTSNFNSKDRFLGTDFWGTSYDCSAFAGQKITLVGAARINAGDYQIRHMNMLQLFDSEVLSIDESKEDPYVYSGVAGVREGTTTILYAADPKYQGGYDTDDKTVMEYMSTVREEDLIYYESLSELRAAGYTCVGVMAELRNWAINGEGGYSTALKIPMKVSEDGKFLGQTVGTVNTVRIWTNVNDMRSGNVSWKNGTYDFEKGKNSVEGYTSVNPNSNDRYSGQVANGDPYHKTEYANGNVVFGTNTNGYLYGSSLLILGYKSEVDIEVDNGGDGELPTYDMDKGNYVVQYRLNRIIAKDDGIGTAQPKQTDLTVLSKLDTDPKEGATAQRIAVAEDSYRMVAASEKMQLIGADGNPVQSVEISSEDSSPTTVRYTLTDDDGTTKTYTIQVHAVRDTKGTQVTFRLKGVTVGVSVPDITYDAQIAPQAVENNDRIQASAYIGGTDDVRAYRDTEGNMDNVRIGIIQLTATRLVKAVDYQYIELDGTFEYTVTYTNSGKEPTDVYLYDLLPITGDIRESHFQGKVVLQEISANLSGDDGQFTADIQFYYSKLPYQQLYDMVRVFGGKEDGSGRNTASIRAMLENEKYFQLLGTINSGNNHQFQNALSGKTDAEIKREMEDMTGIYAVVTHLGGGKSLSIKLEIKTEGNEAGNLYRNIANSWLGGTDEPLTSNRVETIVLARSISGVVWEDLNQDGIRQDTEPLIPGVTCTLFRWDKTQNQYVPCTEDVTGGEIGPADTGDDGAYQFDGLAAGNYVVAFSGKALGRYNGATTYQVGGKNESGTNDGVTLSGQSHGMDSPAAFAGIDSGTYPYAIAYSLGTTPSPVALHTIEDIISGNIQLTSHVEWYDHQDLGLVTDHYELPETGGMGTFLWSAGGLTLVWISLSLTWSKRKKNQMWI